MNLDNTDALLTACNYQNLDLIKLLLDRGANPNKRDSISRSQPLTVAVEKGNLPMALLLLVSGAKPAKTSDGTYVNEPLIAAVK